MLYPISYSNLTLHLLFQTRITLEHLLITYLSHRHPIAFISVILLSRIENILEVKPVVEYLRQLLHHFTDLYLKICENCGDGGWMGVLWGTWGRGRGESLP